MRRLFLYAVLVAILSSALLAGLGIGAYTLRNSLGMMEMQTQDRMDAIERRFESFSALLRGGFERMKDQGGSALKRFAEAVGPDEWAAKADDPGSSLLLSALAREYGVDELYYIDHEGVVRATSLAADRGLKLSSFAGMQPFLARVYGAGTLFDHGVSISIRTGAINGYFYYSPPGADYILEASINLETYLSRLIGPDFYRSFLRELVGTEGHGLAGPLRAGLFVYDGRRASPLLGSEPLADGVALEDVARLAEEKALSVRRGFQRTDLRALAVGDMPLGFVNEVYAWVSFDLRPYYRTVALQVLIVLFSCAAAVLISYRVARRFFASRYLERVERLSAGIHAIADGDLAQELGDDGGDELAQIAGDIRRMVDVLLGDQERLRSSQGYELVATLSAGLAHDFNNILQSVAGSASLLQEEAEEAAHGAGEGGGGSLPAAKASAAAAEILAAVGRAGQLLKSMGSAAKGRERHMEELSLAALVSECARLAERVFRGGVRYVVELPEGPAPGRGDGTRLRQAILNLLMNAGQACGRADAPQVALSLRAVPGGWELRVEDNGPGIEAAEPARVFEPFYTTKAEGSGLGLPMARMIARDHGGDLVAGRSEALGGASFTLSLPGPGA